MDEQKSEINPSSSANTAAMPQASPVAPQPLPNKPEWKLLKVVLIIAGTVVALYIGAMLLIFLVAFWLGGGGHSNKAEDAMKPIQTQLAKLGAQTLCKEGDNGYSIDNILPWYQAYYSAPSANGLTEKIKNIAASAGYHLHTDSEWVQSLKTPSIGNTDSETYSEDNDYLTDTSSANSSELTVEILRTGTMKLDCGDSTTYGQLKSAPSGGALVYLDIHFPSTK